MANKKNSSKREQSHAGMSYAERENVRRLDGKAIVKKIWDKTPKSVKNCAGSAIIVSMAAGLLAAPAMDECGKQAVTDMAHDISNYTWDPFDGFCA